MLHVRRDDEPNDGAHTILREKSGGRYQSPRDFELPQYLARCFRDVSGGLGRYRCQIIPARKQHPDIPQIYHALQIISKELQKPRIRRDYIGSA